MNLNFYIGAGLWGFASALLIHAVTRRRQIGADAAIGIITTASFAIGVAIISKTRRFTKNFEAALFGNILGVRPEDLIILAGVTIVTVVVVFFLYKRLLFVTFDPDVAPTYGIAVDKVDVVFSLLLSAGIIASMQVLGVTMIAAAIVIPAVIARLVTDRFSSLLFISTGVGAACGLVGIYSSYYLDVSSGATIVLVAAALFAVTLLALRLHILGSSRAERLTVGIVSPID
jgi:manganese/iron transport system permease protein/iron/zinc/copper transport system permease protein